VKFHIDREMCVRRVQGTLIKITRALAPLTALALIRRDDADLSGIDAGTKPLRHNLLRHTSLATIEVTVRIEVLMIIEDY
jgi:hypothetical protein